LKLLDSAFLRVGFRSGEVTSQRHRSFLRTALCNAAFTIAVCCGSGLCTTTQKAQAQERTQGPASETSSSVLVALAKQSCFSATIRVTGFLLPAQEAVVTLELEGYQVIAVDAHEGDRVTSGQILARLARIGVSSPGQREMPAEISLKAPASGRIEASSAALGSMAVPKGDPLFRIAVGDGIELQAEVPGVYLPKITGGQTTVRVQTQGGEILGQVKRIGAEVDKTTQLGHVRAALAVDPNNKFLRIGTFVPATLTAGQSCGVSVPRSAVYYGTDGTTVQIVRAQTVETRRVRVGLSDDQDVEIEEGVQKGEVVVAHAGSALRDGDRVATTVTEDSGSTEQH
jgi:HlyD family secretion protein